MVCTDDPLAKLDESIEALYRTMDEGCQKLTRTIRLVGGGIIVCEIGVIAAVLVRGA